MEEGLFLFSDKVYYANGKQHGGNFRAQRDHTRIFSSGEIGIIGGVYDVDSGVVDFFKKPYKSGQNRE